MLPLMIIHYLCKTQNPTQQIRSFVRTDTNSSKFTMMNYYTYYPTTDDGNTNNRLTNDTNNTEQLHHEIISNLNKKKTRKGGGGGSGGGNATTTSNGKHRGNGGVGVRLSTDPQSVAARERRHKISEKFKTLQSLLPGGRGAKLDTVSMLGQAIQYVKLLKDQISMQQDLMLAINNSSTTSNQLQQQYQHYLHDEHGSNLGIGGLTLDHDYYSGGGQQLQDITIDDYSSRQLLWTPPPTIDTVNHVITPPHYPREVVPLTDYHHVAAGSLLKSHEALDPSSSAIVWPYQADEAHCYDNYQLGTISWEHPGNCAWVNQGGRFHHLP